METIIRKIDKNQINQDVIEEAGNVLVRFDITKNEYDLPDFEQVKALYAAVHILIRYFIS